MNLRVANLLLSLGLTALAVYVFVESGNFSERAAQLPRLLAAVLLIAAVILLVANLGPQTGQPRAVAYPFAGIPWRLWLGTVTALVLLGIGASTIGFYESAFAFLVATTWMMSSGRPGAPRRILVSMVFAASFTLFLLFAFKVILQIPTPPGILI